MLDWFRNLWHEKIPFKLTIVFQYNIYGLKRMDIEENVQKLV